MAALPAPDHFEENLDGFLREVASLSIEESFEATLTLGAALVAGIVDADATGLFLLDHDKMLAETWFPAGDALSAERKGELRVAAAKGIANRMAEAEVILVSQDSEIRLLRARGQLVGAVCFAPGGPAAGPRDHASRRTPRLEIVLEVLAHRIRSHRDTAKNRAELVRHERWFKTMDRQLQILDRERQKFAAVISEGDTFVVVTDPSGKVQWANKAAADAPPGEASGSGWIGRDCREVCGRFGGNGATRGCSECLVTRAVRSREKAREELRREGETPARDFLLTALPIKAPDGTPQEVMLRIQDLTDLDVIRHSESRYRMLFDRSTNAILMVDLDDLHILLANRTATRMLGYSASELADLRLSDLHAMSAWGSVRARYLRGMARPEGGQFESPLRTREGSERWATVRVSRIELQGRQVAMVEFRDVTRRKRAEEALRATERQLETVVANAPIVLFAIDRTGVITLSQGRGLNALGLVSGEAEGKSVHDVYGDNRELIANVERAFAGESFTSVVHIGRLAFETRYSPILDGQGTVTGLIAVAIDVTERRQLEEQLRQSQKMEAIGRLAGGVAHEFNNLLTVILGHSEMLLARSAPDTPLRREAEEIHEAGTRGAWLARQLLAFGRRDLYAPTVLDLNDLVADLEMMLRRLIGEDVVLYMVPSPKRVTIRADRSHIEQVVLNLALNARDAMPHGGRLTIELSEVERAPDGPPGSEATGAGDFVRLTLSDSGTGMTEDVRARIFEPFFTTKERGRSAGLGLCIVYGIVQQSGGDIEVVSAPGEGTTVYVYLPRVDPDIPLGPALMPGGARGAETVLLAEDEDAVRDLLRDMLEMGGYRVLVARSGTDALARVQKGADKIDLLISDVVMPQMGGGELAQRLTALLPGLRVLFVSGYPDDSFVRQGVIDAGAPFLQKPFSLDALLKKVREVLEAPARA